ncbi:hypothetical protein CERSUDRAFT_110058 [Gelatoporia subvermispora B]|uniref:Uncharacterized protein n=1 Tax=Ceriporiopsis subvermispora (strain B) TaxID=914234 RepID=M2QWL8_CERS8|nr:hypothetical protein CERSUDRAFT_110058 [Gelatoporia subvermispora B]
MLVRGAMLAPSEWFADSASDALHCVGDPTRTGTVEPHRSAPELRKIPVVAHLPTPARPASPSDSSSGSPAVSYWATSPIGELAIVDIPLIDTCARPAALLALHKQLQSRTTRSISIRPSLQEQMAGADELPLL